MGCNSSQENVVKREELERVISEANRIETSIADSQLILKNFKKHYGEVQEEENIVYREGIIDATENHLGKRAKLGKTGKFYCGERLNGYCYCCDGNCGPGSGCNCVACMRLDIDARELPRNYLVNSQGRTARRNADGTVYCGAYVLEGVPDCDGYCGPNSGPQCQACEVLQAQWDTRYLEAHI